MNAALEDSGLHFLLALVEDDAARRARRRLGMKDRGTPSPGEVWQASRDVTSRQMPASVLMWMLERDDPHTNKIVFYHPLATDAIRRDILHGVPFGGDPGDASRRLDFPPAEPKKKPRDRWSVERFEEPDIPAASSPYGLIGTLRRAETLKQARAAAMAVSRTDWPRIAGADREDPLPGHARWALAARIDCPPEVRAQFGSHPKFAYRLRQAGVVDGPKEYVEQWKPAGTVLSVMDLGWYFFPERAGEAGEALAPLVRAELGGNVEAWAVFAQLLPTFSGTLPELVATAGAVAYSAA